MKVLDEPPLKVDTHSEVVLQATQSRVGVQVPSVLVGPPRPVTDEAGDDTVNLGGGLALGEGRLS